jgi:hypothetical protein
MVIKMTVDKLIREKDTGIFPFGIWVATKWSTLDDVIQSKGGAMSDKAQFKDDRFMYLACIEHLSQREQRLVIYRCKRIIPEVQEWDSDD